MRAFLALLALSGAPLAGSPAGSSLVVEVRDATGGVLPGATVRVAGRGVVHDAVTDQRGRADLALAPGRVDVEAALDGFDSGRRSGVRLRPGPNRVALTLSLARRSESLEVEGRQAESAGRGFSRVLGEAELAALPDDPDEMEEALRRMAGPGAVLRVDGFAGGRLPPKAQIRQIRFQTSSFAAERHEGGAPVVEIETRPGLGGWRGQASTGIRAAAWNARAPLAPSDTPESYRRFAASLDGPVEKGRSSVALGLSIRLVDDTRTVRATLPTGPFAEVVAHALDRPEASLRAERTFGAFTLRGEVSRLEESERGLGVGGLDLSERGLSRDRRQDLLRLRASGVLFRKLASETRLELRRAHRWWTPRSDAPALLVSGAFHGGGAQRRADLLDRGLDLAQDVDWSHGRHAYRAGFRLEAEGRRGRDAENAGGTVTFASLDDLAAGRPQLFVQRAGDARVDVAGARSALYLQDDWKTSPRLTISAGLRGEAQDGFGARLLPRAGAAWSPRTTLTLQAGFGAFTEWADLDLEQVIEALDGEHASELRQVRPAWPVETSAPATSMLVQLRPGLRMPQTVIGSLGLSWTPRAGVRLGLEAQGGWSASQLHARRGASVTAAGSEPAREPGLVVGDGRARREVLRADVMLGGPGSRGSLLAVYLLSRSRDEADGPLFYFADEALRDLEWGPALEDSRHRLLLFGTRRLPHGVRVSGSLDWESGWPYDVTTGRDDDGDGVLNDRPAGVRRHSARGAARAELGLRLTWSHGFGQRPAGGGPRPVVVRMGGGDGPPDLPDPGAASRFRLALHALVQNALGRLQPLAYSGVLGSPTFGQAVSAGPGRRLELGASLSF